MSLTAQELQHSEIYQALKKNKKVQQSALRLGRTADWAVIKQFVTGLKQTLLEATLSVDEIDEVRRFKHLIFGMESIVLLPRLVAFVKEVEKKEKVDKKEKEQESRRKKYNPGVFVRSTIKKIKGR